MGLATLLVWLAMCAVLPHCAQSVFTQSQKDAMLNAHNNARSIASPIPCTPLPAMTWNTVLANVAQAYADRCIYEHNGARTSDTNGAFSYVGENLYISTNTPSDPAVSVTSWDREKQDYDYATLACAPGKVCGHYTQIVWNSSQQLGCGAKLCDAATTQSYPFDKSKYSKGYIVVCNYGPGGNFRDVKPYMACAQSTTQVPTTEMPTTEMPTTEMPTTEISTSEMSATSITSQHPLPAATSSTPPVAEPSQAAVNSTGGFPGTTLSERSAGQMLHPHASHCLIPSALIFLLYLIA